MLDFEFTRIPNKAFRWLSHLASSDIRVYLAIARKTVGFQKDMDRIPMVQLVLDTGLCDAQVRRSIQRLERLGFIRVFRSRGKIGTFVFLEPPVYSKALDEKIQAESIPEIKELYPDMSEESYDLF